jgi:hypothetical protein
MDTGLAGLIEDRVAAAIGGDPALVRATLAEAARFTREAAAARPALGPGDGPALPRAPG